MTISGWSAGLFVTGLHFEPKLAPIAEYPVTRRVDFRPDTLPWLFKAVKIASAKIEIHNSFDVDSLRPVHPAETTNPRNLKEARNRDIRTPVSSVAPLMTWEGPIPFGSGHLLSAHSREPQLASRAAIREVCADESPI